MNASAQRRLRSLLGASLYILAALWGVYLISFPGNGPLYLLFVVMFSVTMTYWCIVDGRNAGRPILHSFYWLIFFLWPIPVPIYLVWARRLKGLGFAMLHAIGVYGACFVAYNVAGYLAYGNIWFSRLF